MAFVAGLFPITILMIIPFYNHLVFLRDFKGNPGNEMYYFLQGKIAVMPFLRSAFEGFLVNGMLQPAEIAFNHA
jgi:hypothetical protein